MMRSDALAPVAENLQNTSITAKPSRPFPVNSIPEKIPAPADAPECLHLSGNIISATCFTPYTLGYRKQTSRDDDEHSLWEITPRRGSSALHDTLKHLAAPKSGWGHTVVGWTGQIEELSKDVEVNNKQHLQDSRLATGIPRPATTGPIRPIVPGSGPSTYTPPPVQAFGGTGDRMTMKGDYSKPPAVEKTRISASDRAALDGPLGAKGREAGWNNIKPVWLGDEDNGGLPLSDVGRWREYAERVLWPTFHYIIPQTFSPAEGAALEERIWWRDYLRFNNAFADAIMEIYKPGDIIWIHDYHLLCLPEILRQRLGRDVYIGLFVHAPWPSSEIFKILSRRKSLLEGMLAANMVAFQSETYKDHFVSCCRRILGFTESFDEEGNVRGVDTYGSHCAVQVNPIGMDVQKVIKAVMAPSVNENMAKIKGGYVNKKIIVGRDRLDSVRGVLQKLRAFERFLEDNPDWIDKVVLIQITSPSHLVDSSSIEVQVSELVSKINGRFGSIHYTPVQHYPQYLQPEEYFALLRVADLGLITSVRDGMNTASLEYIICHRDTHGPIILSEFTGTAESLVDAIIVNPTNTSQVAEKIKECLEMPPSAREDLHQKLYSFVLSNTSEVWNARFLTQLFKELVIGHSHLITPAVDSKRLLESYQNSKARLFLFDYDGTLTNIVQDPQMAVPADRVIRTLKRLAQDPNNTVWIVSGRDQDFLTQWLGHIDELGLSAEHGCFMRYPGQTTWHNLAETLDMSWQAITERVFQKYTEKCAGSFIERKNVAMTWHYRRAELGLGRHMSELCHREMELALANHAVEVMEGKYNLEVRPRALNKGEIVRMLVKENSKAGKSLDFVFCAGDDRTDEDMFRALNELEKDKEMQLGEVFTVTVGPSSKVTEARWHLLEPTNVVNTVGLCVGIVDPRDAGVTQGVETESG